MPKTGVVTKGVLSAPGYLEVMVAGKHFAVHRLVAAAFIENPRALPVVDHIDGIKTRNHINNLRWSTQKDNIAAAAAAGLMRVSPVVRSGGGLPDERFESMESASTATGVGAQNISRCVRGGQTAGGFAWTRAAAAPAAAAQAAPIAIADDDLLWAELGL